MDRAHICLTGQSFDRNVTFPTLPAAELPPAQALVSRLSATSRATVK